MSSSSPHASRAWFSSVHSEQGVGRDSLSPCKCRHSEARAARRGASGLQEKPEGVENEAVEQVVFADKARARPEAGPPC